jgi:hypothetical protein
MNPNELAMKARKVIDKLARSKIGAYVDVSLNPPEPYRGSGKIRLIVVGQDPTVSSLPGINS